MISTAKGIKLSSPGQQAWVDIHNSQIAMENSMTAAKGKPIDDTLAGQASRQLKVAGHTPIEWRVRESKAVPAIQAKF